MNPTMPNSVARIFARCTAAITTPARRPWYRRDSSSSRTKLCTVRICENASSAIPMLSAIRSCNPVLARRSRRPKKNAAPTTTGTTASVTVVSCGCVIVSIAMPPTRNSTWRDASDVHVASSVCSTARSADRRLVSSPVRRSVKKPGDRCTRCANTSSRSFAITRSEVLVSRYTCTKFIAPCSAKARMSPSAIRSRRARSRCWNAASSR